MREREEKMLGLEVAFHCHSTFPVNLLDIRVYVTRSATSVIGELSNGSLIYHNAPTSVVGFILIFSVMIGLGTVFTCFVFFPFGALIAWGHQGYFFLS